MAEWIAKRIMEAKKRNGTMLAKQKYKKYFQNGYFSDIKNQVDAELTIQDCADCIA